MNIDKNSPVLIVVPNDRLGGAEQILKLIASYYKSNKVVVEILTARDTGGWDDLQGTTISITYSKFRSEYIGALWLVLSSLFCRKKTIYKYVFTSHVFLNGLLGLLMRFKLISCENFVARESTQIFRRFNGGKLFAYKFMYKVGYPAVDLLICQTEDMKKQLVSNLPELVDRTKLVVLGNPFDIKQSINNSEDEKLTDLGRFLVSAGRLIPEKGFDILIRAFSLLHEKMPGLKLVILGEGSERNALEKLIITLNLREAVVLQGFVPNVYQYFKAAALCVVSSRIEGFPNVLLQMMSQNTSVVSTKCAGGIESIPGIISVDVDNEKMLFDEMLQVLSLNTAKNRPLFDEYLAQRSIDRFISEIDAQLSLPIKS